MNLLWLIGNAARDACTTIYGFLGVCWIMWWLSREPRKKWTTWEKLKN